MKIKGNLQVSGTTEGITFSDGTVTYSRQPKLTFGASDFYLSGDGTGHAKVRLKHPGLRISALADYQSAMRLSFSKNEFYLSTGSTGHPVVNSNLDIRQLKSIGVEYPSASDNILIFYAPRAMTLLSAKAVLVGTSSPSVTFSVKSGTDRSSLGTTLTTSTAVTNTTTGTNLILSSTTIATGSWVCLVTTAQSGTVTELDVFLEVEWA